MPKAKENPGLLNVVASDLRLVSDNGRVAVYGQRAWVRWVFLGVGLVVGPYLMTGWLRGWTLGGVPGLMEVLGLCALVLGVQQGLRRCSLRIGHDGWLEVQAGYWGIQPIDRRVDLRELEQIDYEPCVVRRIVSGTQAEAIEGWLLVLYLLDGERIELVSFGDGNLAELLGRSIHRASERARGLAEPKKAKTKRRRVRS